jgi:hypothetical protein
MELLPAPGVHADLAAPSALATPNEQGAAALIKIGLGEGERFLDAQPGAPQDHDQSAWRVAVRVVTGGAHDGDDLIDRWRIGGIAQALCCVAVDQRESRAQSPAIDADRRGRVAARTLTPPRARGRDGRGAGRACPARGWRCWRVAGHVRPDA